MSAEQVHQMELIEDFKRISNRELGKATTSSLELGQMIDDFINNEEIDN